MDNTTIVTQLNAFKTYATSQYFFDFQNQEQIGELVQLVQKVHTQGLPITILGSGTNCLFAFDHYPGLLIKTSLKGYSLDSNLLITSAGEMVSPLIAKLRIPAFMPWVGLPGTFGGALVGNAGCFGFEAKDAIQEITLLDIFTGDKEIISPQKSDFSYRHSFLKDLDTKIVLELTWKLDKMSPFCEKTPEEMLALRRAKQPPGRSCGSFFRNPPDIPAGKLIDELGLKGFRVGDMQISPFHGNFFINTGAATWQDVLELARIVKEKALIQRNIQLHEEVRILLPNTLGPQ